VILFLIGVAVVAFLLWPAASKEEVKKVEFPSQPVAEVKPREVTYQQSMLALASVREFLASTHALDEPTTKALEVVTQSLFAGSTPKKPGV